MASDAKRINTPNTDFSSSPKSYCLYTHSLAALVYYTMPSFATLSVFATVAFSALTSAVPVASPAGVSVPAVARADVLSASAILTNLKTTIAPLAGQLCRFLYLPECLYIKINGRPVAAMGAGDATPDNVAPVVNKITVALTTAIGQVKDLNGQPKDV